MTDYIHLDRQPNVTKIRAEADGIELRHIHIEKAGTVIPQHSHKFSHMTVVACGAIRVELNGVVKGDFVSPSVIDIPAGTKHLFTTLVDDTVIECIHNISRTGEIEIAEEHQLIGVK